MTDLIPDRFDHGPQPPALNDPIVDADATHLQLDERLTIDAWKRLGEQILERREASDWWVGDWLEFGWSHFATDPDTGQEISAEAARLRTIVSSMTTLDLDVLRAARDTARRTPAARRRRTCRSPTTSRSSTSTTSAPTPSSTRPKPKASSPPTSRQRCGRPTPSRAANPPSRC